MKGWITIQLTERGETTLDNEPTIIEKALRDISKEEFFIPVHYRKSKSYDNKIYLFTGYVFLKYNDKDALNYKKLINTQYFQNPLMRGNQIHLTPNHEIKKLKNELERLIKPDVKLGDKVKVIDGKYKNLTAEIIDFNEELEEADLKVTLKCMSIVVPKVPTTCLKKEEDTEESLNSLEDRLWSILKANSAAITKNQIISRGNFTDEEIPKVDSLLINMEKSLKIKKISHEKSNPIYRINK